MNILDANRLWVQTPLITGQWDVPAVGLNAHHHHKVTGVDVEEGVEGPPEEADLCTTLGERTLWRQVTNTARHITCGHCPAAHCRQNRYLLTFGFYNSFTVTLKWMHFSLFFGINVSFVHINHTLKIFFNQYEMRKWAQYTLYSNAMPYHIKRWAV